MAPGLADVLARHAADALNAVDEIRVGTLGLGGARQRRDGPAREARHRPRVGRRRVDECPSGGRGARVVPGADRGRDWRRRLGGRRSPSRCFPRHGTHQCPLGGAGVAAPAPEAVRRRRRMGCSPSGGLRPERGRARDLAVYGVVERTAVAAGTVLAVTAGLLAGCGGERVESPGVHGLAALVSPTSFLAELARRGMRTAVFEGAPAA